MIKKLQVKSKKFERNKGMTLFIAVTIMAILLVISYAVVNIAIKGSQFATSGRDSQFAFYAADSGIECALYWDSKFDSFATSTSGSPISCGGSSLVANDTISGTTTLTRIGGGGDANQTSFFGFVMNQGSNSVPHCAIVTVRKYYVGARLWTYIKSRGYNTCDVSNPRRLERGIEVSY
ncbi:MAG: hypothetical protein A3A96_04485 [Candidatus Zambryskibacteria bacterium RIFCSPLOWO2_01_FULL_39_39]|uniref:Type 4 fimbrial biogenesis protein PilX N-terminal domain-containing protein n=1 Tax=Candidatus Zambryskibacteria bacterium RIFCSPLOWO2_01_FULL_39_39 TaxID=1802758 RepID=A0A1G2TYZ3_9BACT|nr:MAG: hypothetical protein UT00_C0028G0002 [Parcubacteria group bacterium GW2011_GWA1_38_7]OHA95352.1 MAG: hypothetical protein A3B88_02650 [Candidatus Zambryskibacteria bacterium RIFCSPHIGHO2_02_FULL_39_19]OHA97970.1 MAG: hypothetical protein A3F20_04310 [Candidatus Zambryskibacteria bacterium RIFCSPHIGHO2_12_FULL_39_21]OHB01782.1 MAG: hypothetical protein A3A96_04485 [Candidatus Zambryskibacteria bacterium RIFCSPLOWO2_01_FULL_39_39]